MRSFQGSKFKEGDGGERNFIKGKLSLKRGKLGKDFT